jgi:GNAT superfamily N-acetyltransferase
MGSPPLTFTQAQSADAKEIAVLRTAVAERLTADFGPGHWSSPATERGVLAALRNSRLLLAREGARLAGTLRLATKKPWAIDQSCFSPSLRPLYLSDMAVAPDRQRSGIGRRCLAEAMAIARAWPADAIRLDAYDAPAGAGAFYAKCGYREVGWVRYRGTPLIYFELLL